MCYTFFFVEIRESTTIDEKGDVKIVLEESMCDTFFSLPYNIPFNVQKDCQMVTVRYLKSKIDDPKHTASLMKEHLYYPDHYICVLDWDEMGRTIPVGYKQGDYNHESYFLLLNGTTSKSHRGLEFVPSRAKIQGFLQGLF